MKSKIINEECNTRVATYEYSSLIVFLLSYVLLCMTIRSTLKGEYVGNTHPLVYKIIHC
jgi:hypothetical protein